MSVPLASTTAIAAPGADLPCAHSSAARDTAFAPSSVSVGVLTISAATLAPLTNNAMKSVAILMTSSDRSDGELQTRVLRGQVQDRRGLLAGRAIRRQTPQRFRDA